MAKTRTKRKLQFKIDATPWHRRKSPLSWLGWLALIDIQNGYTGWDSPRHVGPTTAMLRRNEYIVGPKDSPRITRLGRDAMRLYEALYAGETDSVRRVYVKIKRDKRREQRMRGTQRRKPIGRKLKIIQGGVR